jgi:very-short-patch-repair endonuclease
MAAVIACGPDAVLSHRSAGRLWRFMPRAPGLPEVTRTAGFRSRRPGIVGRAMPLAADEVAVIDGIPVTSVSRTLFDLASVLSRRQLERALNEAEVRLLTDRLSIPQLLERHPGHRGSALLRDLLQDAGSLRGVTRSELEERFVALFHAHGLPRPRLNAALWVRGRFVEVDCLWDAQRVIVELDGRAAHGTARAFESDRERDRLLSADGWRVVRLTWRQVRDEAAQIADDLRKLLRPPTL